MSVYITYSILAVVAYLIGCISPSIMISNLAGINIKKEGSGNAGTTNVLRVLGAKPALIVLVVDLLKGYIAVSLGLHYGKEIGAVIAFACVVLGHVFPAFYKFKGGKGVATSLGAALSLDFPSAFAMLIIAALGVGYSKKMSVGSILAAVCYPFLIYFYMHTYTNYLYFLVMSVCMALFVIFNHRANIKRLIKHEEPNIDFSKFASKLGINTDEIAEGTVSESESDSAIQNGESPAVISSAVEPEPIDYYADYKVPKLKTAEKKNISVIGNGSFGTAIANVLVHNGHKVTVYGRNKEDIQKISETKMNEKYLPYVILSDSIKYTNVLKTAVNNRDIVIFALPSQSFRSVAKRAAKYLKKDAIVVNLAKGIEQGTLERMSEIAKETMPEARYVALSGPSHAEEIVRNMPVALVAVSEDTKAAETVQDVLMNENVRIYTHDDMIGVELGGALKNVIAIATGISDGMRYGNNARAALMTRATHEITRLGLALGADEKTFAGLTGIGDLMVTCSTNLSRNRRCGLFIGLGLTPEEAVEKVGSTVEGFYTAQAAKELADKHEVEMPITEATYSILKGEITPADALSSLMTRDKKEETE